MKLLLLVSVVLIAFASNSILTRAALADALIGPSAFTAIRVASGAAILIVLAAMRSGMRGVFQGLDWRPALALLVYMIGFSHAYLSLETGTGALILFGGVQLTMFAGALAIGEQPGPARWVGSLLGLFGLLVLFAPALGGGALAGALLMSAAAIGWGLFSLLGRGAGEPLTRMAQAFLLALPPTLLVWVFLPDTAPITAPGLTLALASGALASGLGYALWYTVLPSLDASLAAVTQLTVPVIALAGGWVFLGEPLTLRFAIAAALILGGVAVAVLWKRA